MSTENTPNQSNNTPASHKKNPGKMRRKLGASGSRKDRAASPESPKAKLTTKREFLTLLFPKQKKPGPSLKKRADGKGQRVRRKKLHDAQAVQNVSADVQQPVKLKNELALVSQETPLLQQTASRRKFIKMAGMSAAAAALWRKAVATGGGSLCSYTADSGYASMSSSSGSNYNKYTERNDEFTEVHIEGFLSDHSEDDDDDLDLDLILLSLPYDEDDPSAVLLHGELQVKVAKEAQRRAKISHDLTVMTDKLQNAINSNRQAYPNPGFVTNITSYTEVTTYISEALPTLSLVNTEIRLYAVNNANGTVTATIRVIQKYDNGGKDAFNSKPVYQWTFTPKPPPSP